MKLLKAQTLKIGDTIGIIAPSSPPRDPALIDPAIQSLRDLGFKIKLGSAVRKRNGYLAGSDKDRAKDLNRMFADKSVSAILCLRGGYGSGRLLDAIDYNSIIKNPKIFCGYSDITALHLAIFKKTGLITFHGPTLLTLCSSKRVSENTLSSWLRALMSSSAYGDIQQGMPKKGAKIKVLSKGKAEGQLVGGNLSIIGSLVGTQYLPSFAGKILFIEDVNEAPYRVDRIITQLLSSGALKGLRGVVIGDFAGEGDFDAVFKERFACLKVPVVSGFAFGHIDHFATIPHGATAILDTFRPLVSITSKATR